MKGGTGREDLTLTGDLVRLDRRIVTKLLFQERERERDE